MVGPAPEHDRSGNTRAFHEFSAQPLAALSDSQLPTLGPLGALSIERRLRIPRSVAGCHGSRARRAQYCARPHPARGRTAIRGRRCAALVASRVWRWRPHPDHATIFSGFPSSLRITSAPLATPRSSIRWFRFSKPNHSRRNRQRAFPFRPSPRRRVRCWNIAAALSRAPRPPVRMDCR